MKRRWFRRNWLGFLEYGLGLLIALGIFYVFVTFYDDWLAFSAFATLLLALAAFLAIRHSSEQEKHNRKERLLNEIIEWATDVVNCGFGHEQTIMPEVDEIREKLVGLGNKIFRYQAIDTRSKYITKVAEVFGKELHTAVLAVISCLNNVRINLPKCIDNFGDESSIEMLSESEHGLRESTIKLIELATNIKTKDIG